MVFADLKEKIVLNTLTMVLVRIVFTVTEMFKDFVYPAL